MGLILKKYHITINIDRRFFIAAAGITATGILVSAALLYLLIARDPLDLLKIRVRLEKQPIKTRMGGTFPVTAQIDQHFSIPVKDNLSVHFPFKEQISVPIKKTLNVPVELNTTIPIAMTVPFNSDIPVDTKIYLDTEISASVLGIPFKVPIKGYVPVHTTIPVSQLIEIKQDFHLRFRSPVKVDINDTFWIPVDTIISTDIPLETELDLPFKQVISANVSLTGPGEGNEIPNLYILNNSLELELEEIRIDRKGSNAGLKTVK